MTRSVSFIEVEKECKYPEWIGDGICDDLINNEQCDYDLDDCCFGSFDRCFDCYCHLNNELMGTNSTCEFMYIQTTTGSFFVVFLMGHFSNLHV